MFEIAGGIILAVLFFAFLPQILALGGLVVLFVLGLIVLVGGLWLFEESPALAGMLALAGAGFFAFWRSNRGQRFKVHDIERRLTEVLSVSPEVQALLNGRDRNKRVYLERGFTLCFSPGDKDVDGYVCVEVLRSRDAQRLCNFSARWNGSVDFPVKATTQN